MVLGTTWKSLALLICERHNRQTDESLKLKKKNRARGKRESKTQANLIQKNTFVNRKTNGRLYGGEIMKNPAVKDRKM